MLTKEEVRQAIKDQDRGKIRQAFVEEKQDVNDLIMEIRSTPHSYSLPPLHYCARMCLNESLDELLKVPNIKINKQAKFNEAAIHWAIERENVLALLLLANHPDIDMNLCGHIGKAPFEYIKAMNNAKKRDFVEKIYQKKRLQIEDFEHASLVDELLKFPELIDKLGIKKNENYILKQLLGEVIAVTSANAVPDGLRDLFNGGTWKTLDEETQKDILSSSLVMSSGLAKTGLQKCFIDLGANSNRNVTESFAPKLRDYRGENAFTVLAKSNLSSEQIQESLSILLQAPNASIDTPNESGKSFLNLMKDPSQADPSRAKEIFEVLEIVYLKSNNPALIQVLEQDILVRTKDNPLEKLKQFKLLADRRKAVQQKTIIQASIQTSIFESESDFEREFEAVSFDPNSPTYKFVYCEESDGEGILVEEAREDVAKKQNRI